MICLLPVSSYLADSKSLFGPDVMTMTALEAIASSFCEDEANVKHFQGHLTHILNYPLYVYYVGTSSRSKVALYTRFK